MSLPRKRATLEQLRPSITERELGTILAALRYWQHVMDISRKNAGELSYDQWQMIHDIATSDGRFKVLSTQEIDALCDRMNTSGSHA